MKRLLSSLIVILFANFTAFEVSAESAENHLDQRQILFLNGLQRQHVVGEMRALLSGIQAILEALSADDMVAVAQFARPLGAGMASKAEDHLKGVLPPEFMQLGIDVHNDFDLIAELAESSAASEAVLGQLSTTMKKCLVCHSSYQIHTRRSYQSQGKKLTGDDKLDHLH